MNEPQAVRNSVVTSARDLVVRCRSAGVTIARASKALNGLISVFQGEL